MRYDMKFLAGTFFGIILTVFLLVTMAAKPKPKPTGGKDLANDPFWNQAKEKVVEVKEKVIKPPKPKKRQELSFWKRNHIHCFHTYEDDCDCNEK